MTILHQRPFGHGGFTNPAANWRGDFGVGQINTRTLNGGFRGHNIGVSLARGSHGLIVILLADIFRSQQRDVAFDRQMCDGGGGFRFIYASFLQEAADLLARPALGELAEQLIDIGDEWREFALATARMIRDRDPLQPPKLADKLRAIADREQAFFRDLRRAA